MTTEEQRSWLQRWDRWIVYGVVIVIPILVTVALFWVELERRVDAVNRSRAETTYAACLEQNAENANAIAVVTDIFDESVEAGEQTRAEADTALDATSTIINALAPVRDCEALVRERFGYIPQGDVSEET